MSKKPKYLYALYSEYTDSFVTSTYDSIENINRDLENGIYDDDEYDTLSDFELCKIEVLDNYKLKKTMRIEKE